MFASTKQTLLWTALLSIATAGHVRAEPDCDAVALPSLGAGTLVTDLGDDGRAVGAAGVRSATGLVIWHAVLWQDGKIIDLSPLATDTAVAVGLSDDGTIVGVAKRPVLDLLPLSFYPVATPLVWRKGARTPVRLPLPAGPDPLNVGGRYPGILVRDINGPGQIVGNYADDSACLLWRDATSRPERIDVPGAVFCSAVAINGRGDILLQAVLRDDQKPLGEDEEPATLLVRAGRITRIVPPEALAHPLPLLALDDQGTVFGNVDPNVDAFSWRTSGDGGGAPQIARLPGMVLAVNGRGDVALARPILDDGGATSRTTTFALALASGSVDEYGTMDGLYPMGPEALLGLPFGRYDLQVALNDQRQLAWTKHEFTTLPSLTANLERHAYVCQLR